MLQRSQYKRDKSFGNKKHPLVMFCMYETRVVQRLLHTKLFGRRAELDVLMTDVSTADV